MYFQNELVGNVKVFKPFGSSDHNQTILTHNMYKYNNGIRIKQ